MPDPIVPDRSRSPVRPRFRRSAGIAAVGQTVLVALMAFAAVDSTGPDGSMFWALSADADFGVVAALLLAGADHRTDLAASRINQAVVVVIVGFCIGALGAFFGGNLLVLVVPMMVGVLNAILIGAARSAQAEPLPD